VLVSRDARRQLPARVISGQEMFSLDDLAKLFELVVREDTLAGGITVTWKNQTIVLTPGQSLASISGRLISLPAAPARDGRTWFVPVDFVPRALSPAMGTRLELRKPSRLLIVGDLRVPRVAGPVEPQGGALTRSTLDVAPATPHSSAQDGQRIIVKFDADAIDATVPATPPQDLVSAVRATDAPPSIAIDLGPKFGSFRATDVPGDRGTGRIVIDVIAQTTEPAQPGQPAQPTQPTTETPPLLDIAPAGALRTIVIDAGHGGEEQGARGRDGTLEKDVTLSVARRLKAALEARLGVRVILTRDTDVTVGLDERAAVANNNKARSPAPRCSTSASRSTAIRRSAWPRERAKRCRSSAAARATSR
jgi:N-acetylmuramoyl-L-alanine amidase